MSETSTLLKVNNSGKLLMLDIKNEKGQVLIASKEWEEAVNYAFTLSVVNDLYSAFLKSENSFTERKDLPDSL